jgi:hypothetical protein
MASSKDIAEAKRISAAFRQLSKRFFEDFYAKAAKAGRHPLPLEAMGQLCRIITRAAEEYQEPPEPPHQPRISADAFEALLDSNLVQQSYLEAVSAYGRHTPGLKIKKGIPGPKPNVELARRIWTLDAEGKTNKQIHKIVNSEGWNISLEAAESYLKTRRRKRKSNT